VIVPPEISDVKVVVFTVAACVPLIAIEYAPIWTAPWL